MSSSVVNGKCVFPCIDRSKDRRVTVTDNQIKQMNNLRRKGLSIQKIADQTRKPLNVVKAYVQRNYPKQFAVYTGKVNKRRYATDERFRTMLKKSVNENQKLRYKNDIEYRIYQCCKGRCTELKKRYGSLEKYREFKLKCYKYEIDPTISKERYKVLVKLLRAKYTK